MRMCSVFIVVLALLNCARDSYGLRSEQVGPDSVRGHPTFAQTGWPTEIVELLRHESRVYSRWVNGNENFYFKASPDEINDLIRSFSEMRMRDHVLLIKVGEKPVQSFGGDRIHYNVNLYVPAIKAQRDESLDTIEAYEPTLTVFVDPAADQVFWKKITLPDSIILNNEAANCPLKGKATKPKRKVWFAQVYFDDSTPAADFEHGVSTKVTLWEKNVKAGILLGKVNHEGHFHAAISDQEFADLKAGKSWLTLTLGNGLTEARRDHPKLSVEKLSLGKQTVQPVTIAKPEFYYGRILFEDASPPILDPAPWPGAAIRVDFSCAGSAHIDSEGYFKVYFTKEQYEKVKADKVRQNIYIPSYEEKGSSTARFEFPASKLSRDKEEAGVVRIPKPGPQREGAESTPQPVIRTLKRNKAGQQRAGADSEDAVAQPGR